LSPDRQQQTHRQIRHIFGVQPGSISDLDAPSRGIVEVNSIDPCTAASDQANTGQRVQYVLGNPFCADSNQGAHIGAMFSGIGRKVCNFPIFVDCAKRLKGRSKRCKRGLH
jgi:hypothetical protein